MSNRSRKSLRCPTALYPCSARALRNPGYTTKEYQATASLQNVPEVFNRRISLQCRTAEYPGKNPTAEYPNLQCPTAEYPCGARPQRLPAVWNCREPPQCAQVCIPNPKNLSMFAGFRRVLEWHCCYTSSLLLKQTREKWRFGYPKYIGNTTSNWARSVFPERGLIPALTDLQGPGQKQPANS